MGVKMKSSMRKLERSGARAKIDFQRRSDRKKNSKGRTFFVHKGGRKAQVTSGGRRDATRPGLDDQAPRRQCSASSALPISKVEFFVFHPALIFSCSRFENALVSITKTKPRFKGNAMPVLGMKLKRK